MNAASLWPGESVFNVRTVDQQIERFMVRERTFALLSSTFGLLAVVRCAKLRSPEAADLSDRQPQAGHFSEFFTNAANERVTVHRSSVPGRRRLPS